MATILSNCFASSNIIIPVVSQKISKNMWNSHPYSNVSTQLNLAKDYLAANGAVQRVTATIFPQNKTYFFIKTVHCTEISSSTTPVHAHVFPHFSLETAKWGRDISIFKHSADFTISASRTHSMKMGTSFLIFACFIVLIIPKKAYHTLAISLLRLKTHLAITVSFHPSLHLLGLPCFQPSVHSTFAQLIAVYYSSKKWTQQLNCSAWGRRHAQGLNCRCL